MAKKVIDVSKHQGKIDLENVKEIEGQELDMDVEPTAK